MKFEIEIPEIFCELSGIYKIENDVDDRVYIGRAKNLRKRADGHKQRYRRRDCNKKVNRFLEEHPEATFRLTVIEFTNNIKAEEEKYIAEYKSVEEGFNILHNDEEFLARNWEHSKKKKKKNKKEDKPLFHDFMGQDKRTLSRGYLRENGRLVYCPHKAKKIKEYIEKEEAEKVQKNESPSGKRISKRDKDWKPMSLSFLFRRSKK